MKSDPPPPPPQNQNEPRPTSGKVRRHLMLDGRNAFCKAPMGEHDRATHILTNVTCGACRQEFTSRVPPPREITLRQQLAEAVASLKPPPERDDDAELRVAFDGSLRLGILRMDLEQAIQLVNDLYDTPSVRADLDACHHPVAHAFADREARKDLAARLRAAAVLLEIE